MINFILKAVAMFVIVMIFIMLFIPAYLLSLVMGRWEWKEIVRFYKYIWEEKL